MNRIPILQKKAVCTIVNAAYNAHTNPIFLQLSILPYNNIIRLKFLQFLHSVVYDYCNASFNKFRVKNLNQPIDNNLRNIADFLLPPA